MNIQPNKNSLFVVMHDEMPIAIIPEITPETISKAAENHFALALEADSVLIRSHTQNPSGSISVYMDIVEDGNDPFEAEFEIFETVKY